jgi:hypothetical protein
MKTEGGRIAERGSQKSERPAFQRACFRGFGGVVRGNQRVPAVSTPRANTRRVLYNQVGWETAVVASVIDLIDARESRKLAIEEKKYRVAICLFDSVE